MLAAASAAGIELWLDGDRVRWRAAEPDSAILEALRAHKPEILAILAGNRCRHCGEALAWPEPVGVIHGDGRASCFRCYYEAAAQRAVAGVVATSDDGDLIRPEEEAEALADLLAGAST